MKLFYIQPVLAGYRTQLLKALSTVYEVTVLAENSSAHPSGFSTRHNNIGSSIDTPILAFWNRQFFYQCKVNLALLFRRPDVVIGFANPRFMSYWVSLLLCRVLGIRFYSHGQGLYGYPRPGMLRRLMYRQMTKLSTRYICYTELSRASMLGVGCITSKLAVAENSVALTAFVMPGQRTYKEKGILFIGRLREDCRLELLVAAIRNLKKMDPGVVLHVIGDGVLAAHYKKRFVQDDWIIWHGAIHDDARIAEISLDCRIGCYPGDAGLSIVHMFGVSLPPVAHGSISEHMGPEPSYIADGDNGFLFNKDDIGAGLSARLHVIWALEASELGGVGQRAYESYLSLNAPPLGERFLHIIKGDEPRGVANNRKQDK